jgi:hypothetical protein
MDIEKYFYENFKQEELAYVFYTDIIDHFVEYTEFDMLEVSKYLKTNLTVIDGKVLDIICITNTEINNTFDACDYDSS